MPLRGLDPIMVVYENGGPVAVGVGDNLQLNFPSLVYDVAGVPGAPPYVRDAGGDWRFLAPFRAVYAIELRGSITGQLSFAYSINGGEIALVLNATNGFNCTDFRVVNAGDLIRFRVVDLSGFGGAVEALHCSITLVGFGTGDQAY